MSDKREMNTCPTSMSRNPFGVRRYCRSVLSSSPRRNATNKRNLGIMDRRFFGPYRRLKGVTPGGESWLKTVRPGTDRPDGGVGGMISRLGGGYLPPTPEWTLEGVARIKRLNINRQDERGPDKAPSVDFSRKPYPKDFAQADHKAAFALGGRGVWPAIRASHKVTVNLPSTLYALYPLQA